MLIVLRSDRLHRFVQSGNSVQEELTVSGLKSIEVVLEKMEVLFDTAPQRADDTGAERWTNVVKRFVDVVKRMRKPESSKSACGVGPQCPGPVLIRRHGLSPEAKPMSVTDGLDVWERKASAASWGACSCVGHESVSFPIWVARPHKVAEPSLQVPHGLDRRH